MLCPQCGFDSSGNCERYPTLGPAGRERSVSTLRREWQGKQGPEIPVTPVHAEPEPQIRAASKAEIAARLQDKRKISVEEEFPPRRREPPAKKRKLLPLLIAVCAIAIGLGFWLGTNSGGTTPAETGGAAQMHTPPETTTEPADNLQLQAPPEITQPRKLAPYVDVAANWTHVVALHADGRVSVAIDAGQDFGQGETEGWENITDIDAGYYHTVGLREDGTVVATGANYYGQCDVSEWTDIIAVSAGDDFTIGLKSDGTLVATGSNDCGQCDVGDLTDIIEIEATAYSVQCLDSSGRWHKVGDGSWHGSNGKKLGIVKLGAGHYNSAGICEDGTAKVIENNELTSGKLDISFWDDLVDISAGSSHFLGLRSDGSVLAVGKNEYGECDVSNWTDMIAICAGHGYSVGVRSDGTVAATGVYPNSETPCDVSALNELI